MEKSKIIEENTNLATEILVIVFNDYTNSKRINEKLKKNSSWIKNRISRLKKEGYLEEKNIWEKTKNGKTRKIPLVRLKSSFIFYYLDNQNSNEFKFNEKEKKYLEGVIRKNRKLIASTIRNEKLYLNLLRSLFLTLSHRVFDKVKNRELKSLFLQSLVLKLVFQTIIYREKSERFRAEWNNLAGELEVLGNLKEKYSSHILTLLNPL